MNTNPDAANKLWDDFLNAWPIERVKAMPLEEYTNVGNEDTFTYWLEKRLEDLGSIWGGSSFKFGVYERKNTEQVKSERGRTFGEKYAWYSKYGETAELAFQKVKSLIVQVVEASQKGDLEAIDGVDIGGAYKWKIAFHYQDRSNPKILGIFIKDAFANFLNDPTAVKKPFSYLHSTVFTKKPVNQSIFEYTDEVWNHWQRAIRIWKMSHGTVDFSDENVQFHKNEKKISIHKDTGKSQGEAFRKNIRIGDLFYLCHGNKEIMLVGKIVSDVMDNSTFKNGWVARKYEVLKLARSPISYSGIKKGWTPNFNSTLKLVPSTELEQFENFILKPFFDCTLSELEAIKSGELPPEIISEGGEGYSPTTPDIPQKAKPANNVILYGPPGTGKTYELTKLFEEYTSSSSSESEDSYLARLVSDKPWWQILGAAVLLTEPVKVRDLLKHKLVLAKLSQSDIKNPGARLWATLQSHTVQECENVNYQKRLYPQFLSKDDTSNWSIKTDLPDGLPWEIKNLARVFEVLPQKDVKRYEFVTFHQSYGYEEFIEGIRPVTDYEDEEDGGIKYRIEPGVFKKLCHQATKDPNNNYAIFIDEINRGNISKIFGELITLVELDKRVKKDGTGLKVHLPYSKQEFGVPDNLSIFGTMNTADRSIALIDIALRRRFQFKEMMPKLDIIEKVGTKGVVDGVDVKKILKTINSRIEFLYDRDHMIGHSYFLNCTTLDKIKDVFLQNVIPLLQEYFYGDWEKICLVLGCGSSGNGGTTKNPHPIIKTKKFSDVEILGFDHQDYDNCDIYEVDPSFIEASSEDLKTYLTAIYQDYYKRSDS